MIATLAAVLWAGVVAAQEQVTLRLTDGSFSISGQIIDFDAEFYRLSTDIGDMTLAADTVVCEGAACPDMSLFTPIIKISGASTLGERLIPALIGAFAQSKGYTITASATGDRTAVITLVDDELMMAEFHLTLSTTGEGLADIMFGNSDIVMSRRLPSEAENFVLSSAYKGPASDPLRTYVIAWEHLRLYTTDDTSTGALTIDELLGMVGTSNALWPRSELSVRLSGDLDSITALRQQFGITDEPPLLADPTDVQPGDLVVTPNLSLPLKHVELSATCGRTFQHNDFSISAHPLNAPIYLFTPSRHMPAFVREFLTFSQGTEAQTIVRKAGFLSRDSGEVQMASDDSLLLQAILNSDDDTKVRDLREVVETLFGAGRLSLTFRFEDGSRTMDAVSKSNLNFLAELLADEKYQDREIIFAGFSDNSGAADGNKQLSLQRAAVVRDATLAKLAGADFQPAQLELKGFGEVLPIACNTNEWGKAQNRRVEVWIR